MVMVASTSRCSQPSASGAAPAAQACSRAYARAARIRGKCVASIRLLSSRHNVVVDATCPNTWDRSPTACPPHRRNPRRRPPPPQDRRTPPRAHGSTARGRYPPTPGDLRRQPSQLGEFPQHTDPGVRHHTTPVGADSQPGSCCATLHQESAFPFGIVDRRDVSLFLAGQALSAIQSPCHTEFHANLQHRYRPLVHRYRPLVHRSAHPNFHNS